MGYIMYTAHYTVYILLYILFMKYILSVNYTVKTLRAYHFDDWNQL